MEAAMCHWSSRDYERRLGEDPMRSFFQALRDLFRRRQPQRADAEIVALSVRKVIPDAAPMAQPDRPRAA
jgi:hypothetical protein